MTDWDTLYEQSKIRNIIFDFGGVLLNLDPKRSFDGLEALMDFKLEKGTPETEQLLDVLRDFERGQINEETFIWRIQKLAKGTPDGKVVVDTWNAMLLDVPIQNIELLRSLQASKFKCYLLSNTNAMHIKYILADIVERHNEKHFELYFDGIVYSHTAHTRKPEPEIYQHLIDKYELDPAASIFIDDMPINVEAARSAGLQAVVHPQNAPITEHLGDYLTALS